MKIREAIRLAEVSRENTSSNEADEQATIEIAQTAKLTNSDYLRAYRAYLLLNLIRSDSLLLKKVKNQLNEFEK